MIYCFDLDGTLCTNTEGDYENSTPFVERINIVKKSIKNFNYEDKYILSVMSCVRYHNIINLLKAFKLLIKEINYNIKLVLYYNTI